MPRSVLLDEWRIVIAVPVAIPAAVATAFRRRINAASTRRRVVHAIRTALGSQIPPGVRITVER